MRTLSLSTIGFMYYLDHIIIVVTVFLVCPTMVTGEHARRSWMNPSQAIYGGTNWKVSLLTYSQILYCFHQITNTSSETRHFHLASLSTTQWTNRLRLLLTSLQSFHFTCSFHTVPHPINNPIHSTCGPINCQPIAWTDVTTYQLLLSRPPSTQSNYLYEP
jgi:hypothetical protein